MTLNGNHTYPSFDPEYQPRFDTTVPSAENAARVAAVRKAAAAPRLEIHFPETGGPTGDRERMHASFESSWEDPDAVDEPLAPVPAFDTRLLPESLLPMVQDTATRMQVPIDFAAVAAVMCLAGAVNRRASIQPKRIDDTWIVIPNLWGAIVAEPGQKKTPTINTIAASLRAIEATWREEWLQATSAFELDAEEAEIVKSAWRDTLKRAVKRHGERPERPQFEQERPQCRRLITSDPTFEAIHVVMANNPAGIFLLRDELTGWLASLDRQGREDGRAFFLEAWNGDSSFTVDRIGRGMVHVEHCCMSLFGGIQPARLRAYLADSVADGPANDGLIQRFQLLVWPDSKTTWQYDDRAPSRAAQQRAEAVFRRLAAMPADQPRRFRFGDEAQELFVEWLTELEQSLLADTMPPVMVAHMAKYRSLMPSLALLFALADGCEHEVPLRHAQQAAAWCVYLEQHAHRVYQSKLSPERGAAAVLARRLRGGWMARETFFTLRDAYRGHSASLTTPDEARAALRVLEDAGWVRRHPRPSEAGKGRPADVWSINPRIYGRPR